MLPIAIQSLRVQLAAYSLLVSLPAGVSAAWAQTPSDVMPAVVYLQGNRGVK
jgi:hypothetical protein